MTRMCVVAIFLLSSFTGARADDFRAYDVEIIYPWTRATAPGQSDGAVFMKLSNTGDYADRLLRASSPMAGHVQVRPGRTIDIAPGETVTLAPGGAYVALGGLAAPLVEGTTVPLTLTFERGGTVDVAVTVAGPDAAAPPSE